MRAWRDRYARFCSVQNVRHLSRHATQCDYLAQCYWVIMCISIDDWPALEHWGCLAAPRPLATHMPISRLLSHLSSPFGSAAEFVEGKLPPPPVPIGLVHDRTSPSPRWIVLVHTICSQPPVHTHCNPMLDSTIGNKKLRIVDLATVNVMTTSIENVTRID